MPTPLARANPLRGYSLLELVLAVALVGGTLAPALALMRDGIELSRKIDERQLLSNYAVRLLEERLPLVARGWPRAAATLGPLDPGQTGQGSVAGDFSADGFADVRYTLDWSDQAVDGGLPNDLMRVSVTTYWDTDGDDALDADEARCSFQTKVANP